MNKTIGFIGCGNMAQAMIGGIIKKEVAHPQQVMASAVTEQTRHKVKEELGIKVFADNCVVAKQSDILFLAVKPEQYPAIINEINEAVKEEVMIVTIAAGIKLASIERAFNKKVKVVRTMPNTPSLVGEGMSALCANEYVEHKEMGEVLSLFQSFGKCEIIDESLMDAIPAVSGSSPAYVYMFIEALADGGVQQGLSRKQSYMLAAQAVLGAAKMVLETGKHPGELKDQVCSPGGATIEAVTALEKNNFRGSILSAMESCTDKVHKLADSKQQ